MRRRQRCCRFDRSSRSSSPAKAGDPVRRGPLGSSRHGAGILDHPPSRMTTPCKVCIATAQPRARLPNSAWPHAETAVFVPEPSRYSPIQPTEDRTECTASWASRPARRRTSRRDLEDHAADAGRDDRRRADLALYAGAGAARAGDDVRRRHLGRADDGVALHGRHRLLAAHHGAAVGQVRPPSGAARGPRPDGGGQHRLLAGADAAATDRRAVPAGARRRHRHGGEPRHHPRSLQPRPHQLHDQPRHRGHDGGADAERARRRPAGDRVRLARDLLFHHRALRSVSPC